MLLPVVTSAWRLPVRCSISNDLRSQLDMLSRFTGHDQWDSYTKNWLRRRATLKTFPLMESEKVRAVRLVDDGTSLAILSDKRRLNVEIENGTIQTQHPVEKDTRYIQSSNGHDVYTIRYDRQFDHHILSHNHIPFFVTRHYPYVVTDHVVMDQGTMNTNITISIALSSKEMIVGTLDLTGGGGFRHFHKTNIPDVALTSVALDDNVYHGMLNGDLYVYDKNDVSSAVYHRGTTTTRHASSIRCLDAVSIGENSSWVFLGNQDGIVKACRYDMTPDRVPEMNQCSTRKLHRFPVCQIRFSSGRIATCDESGRVVVTDMYGAKIMYDLTFQSHDETYIDINQRYLVVGEGNKIHIWDHEDTYIYDSMFRNIPKSRRNGGGRGGGIKT